jgi:hypothetical protein
MNVELIRFKACEKGTLLGFADLYIKSIGLEVYGCKLFQKNGQKWVGMPAREYKDEQTNETKYQNIIYFRSKEDGQAFSRDALRAIEAGAVTEAAKAPAPKAVEPFSIASGMGKSQGKHLEDLPF